MSETIGSMDKLELRKSEDERLYWVDTENGGAIAEEEALKSLGIDPDEHQEPVEAIWRREDTGEEVKVKIVGILARNNRKEEDYLEAEGMTIGIPRSELEFKKQEPEENSEDDPEKSEMRKELKRLTARVEELEARLESQNPPPELQEYEGFKIGDRVGLKTGDKYEIGYKVIGFTRPNQEGEREIIIEKGGQEQAVNSSSIKKREEVSDDDMVGPEPEPNEYEGLKPGDEVGIKNGGKYAVGYRIVGFTPPDADGRRNVIVEKDGREHVVSRSALTRRQEITEEQIEYYPPSPPPPERRERRGIGALLAGLGIAALAGFIGYELGKRGHNYNLDIDNIRKEVANIHQQVDNFEAKNTAQHAHAHRHELRAINSLHDQIAHDHRQEMKSLKDIKQAVSQSDTATAYHFAIRYPWDWAANKVGIYRAEGWLHTLAAKAMEHGHSVRWLPGGHGTEFLQVDGRTNTGYVINVLNQYR